MSGERLGHGNVLHLLNTGSGPHSCYGQMGSQSRRKNFYESPEGVRQKWRFPPPPPPGFQARGDKYYKLLRRKESNWLLIPWI